MAAMKISTQQTQKQIMAPSMQQSIEVLMLPLIDLLATIDQELQNNPLLEITEEEDAAPPVLDEEMRKQLERYENLPEAYNSPFGEEETMEEKPFKREIGMEENLLRQLRIEISDPLDLKIGEWIIGNLDEDGYIKASLEEIVDELKINDPGRIEKVLRIIQNFDPIGIASRTLEECLLTQIQSKSGQNNALISRIVTECLEALGARKYPEIAKKLDVSIEEIKQAAKVIASLDPRPARNFRPVSPHIYIKPDVFVTHREEAGYQAFINEEGIPPLRVNPTYKNMLQQGNLDVHEREFIKERLRNALNFIKSVEQRGQTIRGIAEYILEKQKGFFEQGPAALTPMSLKDVAEALGRNESTISRAVNNKYIDTPQGLFPLKYFFSQGIAEQSNGINGTVASRSIKEEIKDLIASENKTSPLSDQDIQDHFKQKGITIARRTISKYRQNLNLLPSHLRKN